MYMSSQCTNDGTYTLTVTFKMGMDSDMAQVLVQNRVSLALPVIPSLVQREGINVKKMSPNTMMIVNLVSHGRSLSAMSSSATTPPSRSRTNWAGFPASPTSLTSASATTACGPGSTPTRWLRLNLTTLDVVNAIERQNLQVAAGQIGQQPVPRGQQFQLTINTLGRLIEPEQFGDIILKVGQSTPSETRAIRALLKGNRPLSRECEPRQ